MNDDYLGNPNKRILSGHQKELEQTKYLPNLRILKEDIQNLFSVFVKRRIKNQLEIPYRFQTLKNVQSSSKKKRIPDTDLAILNRKIANIRPKPVTFTIIIAIVLLLTNCGPGPDSTGQQSRSFAKGMNIFFMTSRNKFISNEYTETLTQLSSIGINTVFLITFHYSRNETSDSIYSTRETVSDSILEEIIKITVSKGLQPVLKPHIDLENGKFRYQIDPQNYSLWVASYKIVLVRYLNLSTKYNLEYFVIGTELDKIADSEAFHEFIDNDIRSIYGGQLIYSSSFDHFLTSSIWKHVDIIGVNTYFNLCRNNNCTPSELTESWNYWLDYLNRFSTSKGKSIYITEIGYYSREGCAINPGDWSIGGAIDYEEQAKSYESFLCQYSGFNNIQGAFWWQWELNNPWNNDSADYTPHEKPAEDIIRQYWGSDE